MAKIKLDSLLPEYLTFVTILNTIQKYIIVIETKSEFSARAYLQIRWREFLQAPKEQKFKEKHWGFTLIVRKLLSFSMRTCIRGEINFPCDAPLQNYFWVYFSSRIGLLFQFLRNSLQLFVKFIFNVPTVMLAFTRMSSSHLLCWMCTQCQ